MNKKLAWTVMLGAFSLASWAQEAVTVKGTVIDSEDNPVVGATVVIKGTTEGTITDIGCWTRWSLLVMVRCGNRI